jgi:hypothetical protein
MQKHEREIMLTSLTEIMHDTAVFLVAAKCDT